MPLKILITGALGFIGRSLVEEILRRNLDCEIFGIDIKAADDSNGDFVGKINYRNLDIRNENAVREYFSKNGFDGIIHLAAVSRVVDAENDKQNCIETNFKGTKYILENCGAKTNTWFIFGSSREVYGEQEVFPVKENAEKLPINIYGFYKLEGERLVKEMANRFCILRFSNVYGNLYDIPERVVPKFVKQAQEGKVLTLEGGNQEIDFTYIDDTVDSIIRCVKLLAEGKMQKEELHISPGVRNKITDIIDILREENFDVRVKNHFPRKYDVVKFIGDPSRRIQILGNRKFLDLKNGVKNLLNGEFLKRGQND